MIFTLIKVLEKNCKLGVFTHYNRLSLGNILNIQCFESEELFLEISVFKFVLLNQKVKRLTHLTHSRFRAAE